MRNYGLTLLVILSLSLGLAFSALTHSAGAANTPTFIIGPGSKETFWIIKDESRVPAVTYYCGYIHDFTKNGYGGYTPAVQCNVAKLRLL